MVAADDAVKVEHTDAGVPFPEKRYGVESVFPDMSYIHAA